jgi:hypothetical protein
MKKNKKNRVVLAILFVVPLIFYLFLSAGINNFAKLPVVTKTVIDISNIDSNYTFQKKITIFCFLGDESQSIKGAFFNLNQKIYKPFYGFKDFQIIALYPDGNQEEIATLKGELGAFTDMMRWNFIPTSKEEINIIFDSLKTNMSLDKNSFTNYAFIIDKEGSLRGRSDDEDFKDGKLFGYNMISVAELNDKMKDDIKVVLAEYRLALKKNDADREI